MDLPLDGGFESHQPSPRSGAVYPTIGCVGNAETSSFSDAVYVRGVPAASPDRIPRRLPRGRHGLPRRFVVHNQRERMLAAVADSVAEEGYAATTVADIIARARLSRRTFYEHFADKEECFLAAYDAIVEQLWKAIGEAYAKPDDWPAKVYAGLEAFINFILAEPSFARMCIVEVVAAGPAARARRDAAMRVFMDYLEPGRIKGPKGVEVPVLASEVVVGGIYEIIYTRLARDAPEELSDVLPELLYTALVPFTGHDDAVKSVKTATGRVPRRQPAARSTKR
jgi:AcrR family transcriptional regulator